jgi:Fe2+ or Zn2+ uptake regulation protein
MQKYSTLIYLISSPEKYIASANDAVLPFLENQENDYSDVYNYLDKQTRDVSEQTVQNILGFMKSYKVLEDHAGKKTGVVVN